MATTIINAMTTENDFSLLRLMQLSSVNGDGFS